MVHGNPIRRPSASAALVGRLHSSDLENILGTEHVPPDRIAAIATRHRHPVIVNGQSCAAITVRYRVLVTRQFIHRSNPLRPERLTVLHIVAVAVEIVEDVAVLRLLVMTVLLRSRFVRLESDLEFQRVRRVENRFRREIAIVGGGGFRWFVFNGCDGCRCRWCGMVVVVVVLRDLIYIDIFWFGFLDKLAFLFFREIVRQLVARAVGEWDRFRPSRNIDTVV